MSNDGKLRCGVVGVGYLGQHHARIYSELDTTELVGIYDNNSDRAAEIAAKCGCRVFPSIAELGAPKWHCRSSNRVAICS